MLTAALSPSADARQHKLGQPGTHVADTAGSDLKWLIG
jgi:hypothetical protein